MTGASANAKATGVVTSDPSAWDAAVLANGGHLLQSWSWGAFKSRFGWQVARFAAEGEGGTALAQVLFRGKAGVTMGYLPRGPVLPRHDADAFVNLLGVIDGWARRQRMLAIIVEPDSELPELPGRGVVLVPGPEPIQPSP